MAVIGGSMRQIMDAKRFSDTEQCEHSKRYV